MNIEVPYEVKFSAPEDLFTDSFMSSFTKFNSWNDFIEKGNFNKDLSQNKINEFNDFISANTNFNNWNEFQLAAHDFWNHQNSDRMRDAFVNKINHSLNK